MWKIGSIISALALLIIAIFMLGGQASAQQSALPEVVYIGEGPGTFTTPLDDFIIKTRPFGFAFEPGPTYTTPRAERAWGVRGADSAPPALWDASEDFGQVPAGCTVYYIGIDDDIDGRRNRFYVNGVEVELIEEGMVFSGSFVTPEAGDLTLFAEDSVAGWVTPCVVEETATPTDTDTPVPTDTPAPTDTPVPTDTPEPTETPLPTDTATPGPSPTPSNTPPPGASLTPTPVPSATPSNTPPPGASLTPVPSATPSDTPVPSATPDASQTPTPTGTAISPPTPIGTETPDPNKPKREDSCTRINFEVAGEAAVRGLYLVQEIGGHNVTSWYALDGWQDSGWLKGLDISYENVYVRVLFYRGPDTDPVELVILNPAPDSSYGWMSWGVCHALEVGWPGGVAPQGAVAVEPSSATDTGVVSGPDMPSPTP
jgi:hypothetical protein